MNTITLNSFAKVDVAMDRGLMRKDICERLIYVIPSGGPDNGMTVSQIRGAYNRKYMEDATNQRICAMLRKMMRLGIVDRTERSIPPYEIPIESPYLKNKGREVEITLPSGYTTKVFDPWATPVKVIDKEAIYYINKDVNFPV